jgi:hypothetical protein
MPPQGALGQEALSEGPVAAGPHRGRRDGLDPPPGAAVLPPRRPISPRQWLGALCLGFLRPAVRPDDGLSETAGTHTRAPGPARPPRAVAGPPQIGPMQAAGGLPWPPPWRIRHPLLGGKAQTPMPMGGPGRPRNPCAAPWRAEFPQARTDGLAERAKEGFLPLVRDDAEGGSALPPEMAWVVPFSPCGCSFVWPWRVHIGSNHLPLHASTPERQSLCESHRQRRWLTHWS